MTNFAKITARLLLPLAVALTAVPAVALPNGPTDFAPGGNGPDDGGFDGPDDFAPPPAAEPTTPEQREESSRGRSVDRCPNGKMVMKAEYDDDGHIIPSTMSRECVSGVSN